MHYAITWNGIETNPSGDASLGKEKAPLLQFIFWLKKKSGLINFFYICYHAGGSTEHLPRPKVKRRNEDSSPCATQLQRKEKLFSQVKWGHTMGVPVNLHPLTPSSFPLPL